MTSGGGLVGIRSKLLAGADRVLETIHPDLPPSNEEPGSRAIGVNGKLGPLTGDLAVGGLDNQGLSFNSHPVRGNFKANLARRKLEMARPIEFHLGILIHVQDGAIF
jgi:hypothetical protein